MSDEQAAPWAPTRHDEKLPYPQPQTQAAPAGDDELVQQLRWDLERAQSALRGCSRANDKLREQAEAHRATQAASVDWPARFRAAADAAGGGRVAYDLRGLASWIETGAANPDVVEAIGRALLGESS